MNTSNKNSIQSTAPIKKNMNNEWLDSIKKNVRTERLSAAVSAKLWMLIKCMCVAQKPQRRQDICGRTTSIWQFLSEMQQTWHSYYTRPQK
jgi:hypothetical protein